MNKARKPYVSSQKARDESIVVGAEALYAQYSEYMIAGFTSKQAMDIILCTIEATIISQAYRGSSD